MSYYSTDFLDQLRDASDIVSLITEDTTLKGQGDRFMGLCPFPEHNEKTASFSVSQSRQLYHCFGCQNSGNIFTYLQKQRGMNFVESVEYLARKEGIPLPEVSAYKKPQVSQNYFQLSERICSFYEKQLKDQPINHPINNYLKKRAYSKEIIKSFRLGYAPKGNKLLLTLKTSEEKRQAYELGLINRSQNGDAYDNFRNRLIFPIISHRKQVLGFGARALDETLPKYINSKESPIFHKGKIFYGLNESTRYLRQNSFALIVEGYTDFLSLWEVGYRNLGATLGTAFTRHHAALLKRYVNSVVLVFDGDEAGFKASERSLPILLAEGLEVRYLELPTGQDPDDFIRKHGKNSFEKLLKNTKDLFFYLLQKKHQEFKEKGRENLHLIEDIAPILAQVQNKALKVIYTQRLLDFFGSDAKFMKQVLDEKIKNLPKTGQRKEVVSQEIKASPGFSLASAMISERLILILCLENEAILKDFIVSGDISSIKTRGMVEIFKKIEELYGQEPKKFDRLIHFTMNKVADPHFIFKSSYSLLNEVSKENQKQIFKECLDFLKKGKKHSEASELIAEIKMGHKGDIHHLEKIFQLTKQRLQSEDKPKA